MPNARISMSKLKQIIQLQSSNLSVRDLSRALGMSIGAVSKYLAAVRTAGLSWEVAQGLDEAALERRIFGDPAPAMPGRFAPVDCAWIHGELKRHRHVTLQLLWEEYRARHGEQSYRYSAFCEHYRAWEKRLKRSMRQRHFAGEKLFVDYAGPTVPVYGMRGDEAFRAHIFVGALGASGYAYAEATRTETLPDWLGAHVRALGYYGASPSILVPVRARAAAFVRGAGDALQRGGDPGAAVQAEGQVESRADGADRRALDPGEAASPAVL